MSNGEWRMVSAEWQNSCSTYGNLWVNVNDVCFQKKNQFLILFFVFNPKVRPCTIIVHNSLNKLINKCYWFGVGATCLYFPRLCLGESSFRPLTWQIIFLTISVSVHPQWLILHSSLTHNVSKIILKTVLATFSALNFVAKIILKTHIE